jgi:hypothetical protein
VRVRSSWLVGLNESGYGENAKLIIGDDVPGPVYGDE